MMACVNELVRLKSLLAENGVTSEFDNSPVDSMSNRNVEDVAGTHDNPTIGAGITRLLFGVKPRAYDAISQSAVSASAEGTLPNLMDKLKDRFPQPSRPINVGGGSGYTETTGNSTRKIKIGLEVHKRTQHPPAKISCNAVLIPSRTLN
ncbi:hypothetical protein RSAG8_02350, partial [Rhizoctonia solani AG-8 WAC10335]